MNRISLQRCVWSICLGLLLTGCSPEIIHEYPVKPSGVTTRPAAEVIGEADTRFMPLRRMTLATTRPAATRPARITLRRPPEYTDSETAALSRPSALRASRQPWFRAARNEARVRPQLVIDFLDVGQGDSILVSFPNGKRLLVDCGSNKNGPISKIRPALLARLDAAEPVVHELVITHPDQDHYNRLADALEGVVVGRVTTVGDASEFGQADTDQWLQNTFIGSRYRIITVDETTPLPAKLLADFGDARAEIVAANVDPDGRNSPNSRSIVLKISYGRFDCLLTGDATFETEEAIANRYADALDQIDVEVLKLGHHGSRATSTSPDWLRLVKPEATIVSCGNGNRYGHPSNQVVRSVFPFTEDRAEHAVTVRDGARDTVGQRLDTPESVFSTENSGNIRVTSDGGSTFTVIENAP